MVAQPSPVVLETESPVAVDADVEEPEEDVEEPEEVDVAELSDPQAPTNTTASTSHNDMNRAVPGRVSPWIATPTVDYGWARIARGHGPVRYPLTWEFRPKTRIPGSIRSAG